MQNNGPKSIISAIKAIILHTVGVQVAELRLSFMSFALLLVGEEARCIHVVRTSLQSDALSKQQASEQYVMLVA